MKKIIVINLIFIAVLSSCVRTEKIDNFPIEKPKIVVNSFIKNNQPIEFFITKSLSSIDNAKIKKVTNAEIKIYENGNLVETVTKESSNPNSNTIDAYYLSTIKPKIGNRYSISVSSGTLATVTADAYLPNELTNVTGKLGKIDTTVYINNYSFNNDSAKYNVVIKSGTIILSIPDDPSVKNYYKINLKVEEKYWDGAKWDYRYRTIFLKNDGGEYDNYNNGLFLTDKLYDGKNIPVKLDMNYSYLATAYPKLKFKVIVTSQSEEKQKYDISLGQYYQNQDNPFVEPTLVYSNILGGYGIFASESEFEIILE